MEQAVGAASNGGASALLPPAGAHGSGDLADLEVLYHEHYADVLAVVKSRVACPDTAADVAQETFARAFQASAAGAVMMNPRAWLLRTARNLCVDHWRHQQRSAPLPDDLVCEERSGPESTVLRAAEADRVRKALISLPPKVRTALIMREIERRSVGEVAQNLGVTVGSASVLLHRARGRARRAYNSARSMLMPPTMADGLRRWVTRASHQGQPLLDGANAACASACAAVLVMAIAAAVVQSGSQPAPARVELRGSATLTTAGAASAPSGASGPAERGRSDGVARTAGTDAGSAPAPASPPRVPPPGNDYEQVTVPGTAISVSNKRPDKEPTVAVHVDEEVAGTRLKSGTEIYADDVISAVDEDGRGK